MPSKSDECMRIKKFRPGSYLRSSLMPYSSDAMSSSNPYNRHVLTTEFCNMLVGILHSLFVGCPGHIKQAIDARFNGVVALIPELERLLGVGSVFVDVVVDWIVNWRDILRSAELAMIS